MFKFKITLLFFCLLGAQGLFAPVPKAWEPLPVGVMPEIYSFSKKLQLPQKPQTKECKRKEKHHKKKKRGKGKDLKMTENETQALPVVIKAEESCSQATAMEEQSIQPAMLRSSICFCPQCFDKIVCCCQFFADILQELIFLHQTDALLTQTVVSIHFLHLTLRQIKESLAVNDDNTLMTHGLCLNACKRVQVVLDFCAAKQITQQHHGGARTIPTFFSELQNFLQQQLNCLANGGDKSEMLLHANNSADWINMLSLSLADFPVQPHGDSLALIQHYLKELLDYCEFIDEAQVMRTRLVGLMPTVSQIHINLQSMLEFLVNGNESLEELWRFADLCFQDNCRKADVMLKFCDFVICDYGYSALDHNESANIQHLHNFASQLKSYSEACMREMSSLKTCS